MENSSTINFSLPAQQWQLSMRFVVVLLRSNGGLETLLFVMGGGGAQVT